MEESEQKKSGFSSIPYNLYNHNCGVYGVDVINQAMPWYRQIAGNVINAPLTLPVGVVGALTGIGHDIEQGTPGTHTLQGLLNNGTGGRADMHGFTLPWFSQHVRYKK